MVDFQQLISLVFSIFIISIWGILIASHLISILISLELLLLSASLAFIIFSLFLNDIIGQIFALLILTVAGAESVIGLAILLTFYRLRGDIHISIINSLKS